MSMSPFDGSGFTSTQRGAWVIAWWDMGWHVDSIHETAEAAVAANDLGRQ